MKLVTGELIDTQFEDKEVGDVGMIQARNHDNKLFQMFCMKEPYYVTTIIASLITLEELECRKKIR